MPSRPGSVGGFARPAVRSRPTLGVRELLVALLLAVVVLAAQAVATPSSAHAAGSASSAADFVEQAQNDDGGFGIRHGRRSDPETSLWASVALLAAGKNPQDEWLKGGRSASDYLIAHRKQFRSVGDLGLLALVQSTARLGASRYGSPATKLRSRLSEDVARTDPSGAALAVFGLLAAGGSANERTAAATGRALLATATSDGAWGPSGNADSASTALVLQALSATRVVGADDAPIRDGLAYLHAAQGNDGGIVPNTRLDKAITPASVPATAFTLQALKELGVATLRTTTGKTVRQGLTDYQQRTSGGLTATGAYDEKTPPSVLDTAQAFAAFDGKGFRLAPVAARTEGPSATKRKADKVKGTDQSSRRVSAGSAASGVSGEGSTASDGGAYRGATASRRGQRSGHDATDSKGRKGQGKGDGGAKKAGKDAAAAKAPKTAKPTAGNGGGGTNVSGTVVGATATPKLATKAGASDDDLSGEQRVTLLLAGTLALLILLGLVAERRRPRPTEAVPPVTAGLAAAAAAGSFVGRPLVRGAARAGGFAAQRQASVRPAPRRRWLLLPVLLVGLALIATPFAVRMFDRAPQGATMIDAFAPYMQEQRLAGFQRDVAEVDAGAHQAAADVPALLFPDQDPATATRRFQQRFPQFLLFAQQWPEVHRSFTDLLGTISANRTNYEAVAALPSFRLFPWFFVVPGALLVLLAAAGLVQRRAWIPLRRALIGVGIGLLLAPLVFQMFTRAPQGGRMIDAFRTVETRATVQRVQGQFGTIAVGQGAIRTELVPALRAAGLSDAQIRQRVPAIVRLQERWPQILGNLTPMIGVMSDNVGHYRAVAALPPFPLFPWLFAVPGLLVVGLGLLAGRRRTGRTAPPDDGPVPPDGSPPSDAALRPSPAGDAVPEPAAERVAVTASVGAGAAVPASSGTTAAGRSSTPTGSVTTGSVTTGPARAASAGSAATGPAEAAA